METNYKKAISTIKENINNNILDYLKDNYTCITVEDSEKYEKDFNLLILCKQKRLKALENQSKNIIVDLYKYAVAPSGYFITYNKFDTDNQQTDCQIFI